MRTLAFVLVLCLAPVGLAACAAPLEDPDSMVLSPSVATITADDLASMPEGASLVLDLSERPYLLDASRGPVDLSRVAVRTSEGRVSVSEWLARHGGRTAPDESVLLARSVGIASPSGGRARDTSELEAPPSAEPQASRTGTSICCKPANCHLDEYGLVCDSLCTACADPGGGSGGCTTICCGIQSCGIDASGLVCTSECQCC